MINYKPAAFKVLEILFNRNDGKNLVRLIDDERKVKKSFSNYYSNNDTKLEGMQIIKNIMMNKFLDQIKI